MNFKIGRTAFTDEFHSFIPFLSFINSFVLCHKWAIKIKYQNFMLMFLLSKHNPRSQGSNPSVLLLCYHSFYAFFDARFIIQTADLFQSVMTTVHWNRHPWVWVCERVSVWACEHVSEWACEPVSMWACEHVSGWACEHVSIWVGECVREFGCVGFGGPWVCACGGSES